MNPAPTPTFSHGTLYRRAPNDRPVVEVEIAAVDATGSLLGRPVTTTVLVDSGADRTMLDGGLAPTLGIDLRSCPRDVIGGVGAGGVPVAEATVKMELCGAWTDVPVSFTLGPIGHPQLLGREGAFDAIAVSFLHRHRMLLAGVA
jgi:hypothetical protein